MLTAAIVGLGRWGRMLVDSVQGSSTRIRFSAAATRSPDKAREYAAQQGIAIYPDYAAVLADASVAAVVLATPHSQHADQVAQAARAGKHVYVEKPFALTQASAEAAMRAVREAGVVVAAGFNRRFRPALLEIKRMVAAGDLGRVVHLEGSMSGPVQGGRGANAPWRESRAESPGGSLAAKGIHIVDQMIWFAGPVESVHAMSDRVTGDYAPLDDVTSAHFRFRSGVTGCFSTLYATADWWRLHVFGTRGWAQVLSEHELTSCLVGGKPQMRHFEPTNTLGAALEAFADAAAGGSPYPVPPEDAINSSAVVEAIARSAERHEIIRLA